jgi:hypothetical protein
VASSFENQFRGALLYGTAIAFLPGIGNEDIQRTMLIRTSQPSPINRKNAA